MFGLMAGSMWDSGLIIKCMGKAISSGLMAGNTLDSISTTRKKVEECSNGLTAGNMKANGLKVGSTAKEFTLLQMARVKKDSGRMVIEPDGQMKSDQSY